MLSSLSPERRIVVAQLARFAVSGAFVTVLAVSIYALTALVLRWNPQLGNFLSYLVAMAVGYVIHSRFSFRDHGAGRDHTTKVRFVMVSLVSYALNAFWVWLIHTRLHMSRAMPILPMLFVTPFATFLLNRQWVFR
jgi:putative flippase GtrA